MEDCCVEDCCVDGWCVYDDEVVRRVTSDIFLKMSEISDWFTLGIIRPSRQSFHYD